MKTILCVDDIGTNLYTLTSLFETYKKDKYKLILASSGQEALGVLLKKKVDLILLDIMMPEMDGYETAQLILSNKKTKNIPIIFLTAKKDENAISKCYKIGGVDYLSKPYNEVELFSRIKFHLNLVESRDTLLKEKEFVQDILDLQENLIIVTNGISALRINKAATKFFDIGGFREFSGDFSCLNNMFVKEDGYFHPDLVDEGKFWIDALLNKGESKSSIVLLENIKTKKMESFDIKVKKFRNNYIISLTNITEFAEKSKHFEHDASYDELTQVYNRAKLNEILSEELAFASDNKLEMSFILLDIDHFKDVNDTYGHLVGDAVLIHMSNLIKNHIRDTDVFARWGGEEFVLVLPNVGVDKAEEIANNLRIKIELEYFAEVNNITCSFGVTSYELNDTIDTITNRADQALYEAKNGGRNQVCKLNIRT